MDSRLLFAAVGGAVAALLAVRSSKIRASIQRTELRFGLSVDQIKAEAASIKAYCEGVYDAVAAVDPDQVTWENSLGLLLDTHAVIDARTTSVTLPAQVSPDAAVRAASAAVAAELSKMQVSLSMRRDVYLVCKAWKDKGERRECAEERLFLKRTMRDYRRAGMHLDAATRAEVEALRRKVKELENTYQQNLSEDNTTLLFTDEELDGLPGTFISGLAEDKDGKRKVTMAYPHAIPVLRNCKVAATREKVRVAFDSRATEQNVAILEEVIGLRAKIASLLGYESHAHYELEVQMAKSPDTALPFLTKLAKRLRPLALRDLGDLQALKEEEEGSRDMKHWDTMYYMRKHLEQKHAINEQEISEYFPLELVQRRMLSVYETLLGVVMTPVANPHVWHKDVTMFAVHDTSAGCHSWQEGRLMGYFYMDLFPRPGKYGHACCVPAQRGAGANADGSRKRIAAAAMLANFAPPSGGRPSLLRHSEVVTFFHEFGHVMHHILSDTKHVAFASFDVETDFVEAPSQMLENWCWEADTLQRLSGHYLDESKPLPLKHAEALAASKDEHTALLTLRQLMFGVFDLRLHGIKPGGDVDTAGLLREMYPEYLLTPMPDNTNFAGSFGHLAGGYDAKYYSYMWSEVFSSDMFATRFKAEGLLNPDTGMSYRVNILAPGGSREAMKSLRKFLGREPNMEAFLRSKGLTNDEEAGVGAGAGAGAGAAAAAAAAIGADDADVDSVAADN